MWSSLSYIIFNISIQSVLGATSRWITSSGRHSESSTSDNLHVLWEFNAVRLYPSSSHSPDPNQCPPWRGALKRECVSLHGRSVHPASQNTWWSWWTAHSNLCRWMPSLMHSKSCSFRYMAEGRPRRSTKCGKRFSVRETRMLKWSPIIECPIPKLSAGNVPGKCMDDGPWLRASVEPDPCLHGWNREHDHLIPEWIAIPEVAAMCNELVKCGCKEACSGVCSCRKHALTCTALCKCQCLRS